MQAYFVSYHTFVIHSGLAKREKYIFGYYLFETGIYSRLCDLTGDDLVMPRIYFLREEEY